MACALTQGYNLDCRDSYGGVKEIYIAETSSVTAITASAGVITAIDKTGTKVFYKYNLVAHTAKPIRNLLLPGRTVLQWLSRQSNSRSIK